MIRLPWVSELAYQVAVARAESAERRAEAAEARLHDLMARVNRQERLPEAKAPEPPAPDLVMMAVGQQAARDPVLARHLAGYVQIERAKQRTGDPDALTDGELLAKVTHWEHTGSEGVPDGFWPTGDTGVAS